ANPVRAIRQVSYDLSLAEPLELRDGSRATALELQWELHDLAAKYAEDRGLACLGDEQVGHMVMERWEQVLHGLETDPASVASQVDWAAKLQLVEGYRERHGISWDDHRLAAVDLQYHDLRPERSLFQRLGTERLVSDEDVISAVSEPPKRTRAYFRGECLRRFPASVASANWDSLVFDLGSGPLRRVPMMDPLRGTEEHTGELLAGSSSPAELLTRLSA
ncbi:MAG: proteasome accessory factor PafA2 family protein, partial [Acidimicrobiales bacterium]